MEQTGLVEIGRVAGTALLQNLAVRSNVVSNSTPNCNEFVSIRNRIGINFASKLNGTLVVQSQLFKLVK
eukprot:scaffold91552_cov18-Tisochrysis_lutea.AAC.1